MSRTGGHESSDRPVTDLPKVAPGPAPGAIPLAAGGPVRSAQPIAFGHPDYIVPLDKGGATIVEEWRVTGDPTTVTPSGTRLDFPAYLYVWRSDISYDERGRTEGPATLTAEQAARNFVERATGWADGPHLHHRTVICTPWEEA